MVEGEASGESEPFFSGRQERLRSEGEQGGTAFAGLVAETMPSGGGEAFEFPGGREMKIEEDEREVAVAEQKVGALDGLGDLAATDPEELLAFEIAVRTGVEGIASVDESERKVSLPGKKFGNQQGHALAGMRGDDFVEAAAFKGKVRGVGSFLRRRGGTMRGRELLTKLTAEIFNFQKH